MSQKTIKNETLKQIEPDTFPNFLKAIRKKNGWTQKQLSEQLNGSISVRTIEGWEQGFPPNPAIIPFINLLLKGV